MNSTRINIFTGHFGSGKTEVAVNFAMNLAKQNKKTCIVDFDIVNPFFRTADVKDQLEKMGMWVVTPRYANTNVDVPALPAEISTLLDSKEHMVVFDVGGDDLGARALSRYREEIEQENYTMFFVINTRRPMTNTKEKIMGMIREIEASSRLRITHLVNNTNLLQFTQIEDILEGQEIIEGISQDLGKPIAFVSGFEPIIQEAESRLETGIMVMDKLIKLPWDK